MDEKTIKEIHCYTKKDEKQYSDFKKKYDEIYQDYNNISKHKLPVYVTTSEVIVKIVSFNFLISINKHNLILFIFL